MPQFDVFFFFNNALFFMLSFTIFYIIMTWVFLPKILKILKIRKQKVDFLTKMNWLYNIRFSYWTQSLAAAFSNITTFSATFLNKNNLSTVFKRFKS